MCKQQQAAKQEWIMVKVTDGDGSTAQPTDNSAEAWPAELTAVAGSQIRHWRQRRKLTTQKLSDATAAVGHRVPPTVLTNLEHRRREYISVAELLLVAAALNVPPILLVAPVGQTDKINCLPDAAGSPWRTRGWFTGAIPATGPGFDLEQWNDATTVIRLYDTHRLLVRGYLDAVHRLRELDDDRMDIYPGRQWPQKPLDQRRRFRRAVLSQLAAYLEQIRAHRRSIEELGFKLPDLASDVEADLANPWLGEPDDAGHPPLF